MRKSTLLLLLAVAACGDNGSGDYTVIEDFMARSPELSCDVLGQVEFLAVTELRAASDSTVLVLDAPGRRLVELNGELVPIWEMELPAVGPGAVNSPVAMTLIGDTAVAIAERQGLQLVVYSRSGELIRTTPLGFAPSSVAARPSGEVFVTAMPLGEVPASLLFRYDEAAFHEVPVAARSYTDMFVGALGNSTLVESLSDGALVVIHQFMAPRAFRLTGDDRIDPLRVPTPDATRSMIDFVPVAPLLEEQMEQMLVPASAMSVDRLRSEVYLLTRSGRRLEGGAERAILRLDAGLELLDSFTLDVIARHIAVLPRDRTVLIVDDEDRFHACDFRRLNGHAEAD